MTAFRARHYNLDEHWDQVHALQEALVESGRDVNVTDVRSFVITIPKKHRNAEDYRKLLENGFLLKAYDRKGMDTPADFKAALDLAPEVPDVSTNGAATSKHPNVIWEELERKLEQIGRDAESLGDPRFQSAILTAKRIAGSHLI